MSNVRELRKLSKDLFNSRNMSDIDFFDCLADIHDIETITPSATFYEFAETLNQISSTNIEYICEILAIYINAAVIRQDTSFELIMNLPNHRDCLCAQKCFNIIRNILDTDDDENFKTITNYLLKYNED